MEDTGKGAVKLVWYASCEYLTLMGPYDSQVAAWEGLRANKRTREATGSIHVPGACVWPRYEGGVP